MHKRLVKGSKIQYAISIVSIVKKVGTSHLDNYRPKKRRWWLWAILLIIVVIIGWYLVSLIAAYNNATTGNDTANQALKQNDQGKYNPINVLLLGTNANLSDSIIVASIDPETKTVSMLSVPRDLYIDDAQYGKFKINEIHSYAESAGGKTKGNGAKKLKEVVSEKLGIPIHYFVRVDFDGFKKIVDSIGGIEINVESTLNDTEYPCDNDPTKSCGFTIKAGPQHMNGTTALKYTRCRKGNCGSDFGRAKRQQEVISAIRTKALSAQVLANPKKVTDLISALGSHMLMDISATEMTQAISVARALGNPTMRTYVFSEDNLVKGAMVNGKSYQVPTAGTTDFSEIQAFAQAYIQQPRIVLEKPTIMVRQGSATKATVAKVVSHLEWAGFTVTTATQADPTTTLTTLYSDANNKPTSSDYLKTTYKVTPKKGTSGLSTTTAPTPKPSASPSASPTIESTATTTPATADYELIIGSDIAKILKESKPLEDDADGQDPLQSPPAETTYLQGAHAAAAILP